MEETHQKKIEDLQRQHQRELEKLREEKDRLLAEETAATISGGPGAVPLALGVGPALRAGPPQPARPLGG